MRRAVAWLVFIGATLPVTALAQVPEEEPPPPPTNPCDVGRLVDFQPDNPPVFEMVHVVSPRDGLREVPRNVEIVLGGFVQDLDAEPPFLAVVLRGPDGEPIPTTRAGRLVRPLQPLAPGARHTVAVEQADEEQCPGCFQGESIAFVTGADVDTDAPRWDGAPVMQAFVPSAEQRDCGFGGSRDATHVLLGQLPAPPPDVARVQVAVKPGAAAAVLAVDHVLGLDTFSFFHTGTEPLALGDRVATAVTYFDLAGNAGPAVAVRVRARAFDDIRAVPFPELDERQCRFDEVVRPAAADTVPSNARFVVDVAVEPVPLALVGEGLTLPLHPVEHLPAGQVLEPAEALPEGATLDLVATPCPSCVCKGCGFVAPVRVTVGPPDERAPDAPVIVDVVEDLDPPPADDVCHPDLSALVVRLERGRDDRTPPEHLRYDAVLRLPSQLGAEVGRALPALVAADGSVAVRLDTAAYGRLEGQRFELELTAIDLAGNRSSTTYTYDGAGGGGCAATDTPTGRVPLAGLSLLFLAGSLALRRRRTAAPGLPDHHVR